MSSSSSSSGGSGGGGGFGGSSVRGTKSVPKGLVVTETDVNAGSGGEEAAVDWSKGQALVEVNRLHVFSSDMVKRSHTILK